jgi:RNA polymerase sigma factor (sigma-70 family)
MKNRLDKEFPQHVPSKGIIDFRDRRGDTVDEKAIWKRFKDGDESAFVYIYNTYYKTLLNLGYQFTKNTELIKDCVQDLFIDIRENKEKLGDVTYVKSYLMVAFKRKVLDYLSIEDKRSNKNLEIAKDMFEIHASHEEVLMDGQRLLLNADRLKNALSQLSKKETEAIYYFFYENMSYKEIGELFNYSQVKTARNLVYMALDKLRNLMIK